MPSIFAVLIQCFNSLLICFEKQTTLLYVILVCLNMFVMNHFISKTADLEDILYSLLEICMLFEIHASMT